MRGHGYNDLFSISMPAVISSERDEAIVAKFCMQVGLFSASLMGVVKVTWSVFQNFAPIIFFGFDEADW